MQNLWPLLLLLACPLMIIFMMKGMHGGGHAGHSEPADRPNEREQRIAELEQQVAQLRDEAAKRADVDGSSWTR